MSEVKAFELQLGDTFEMDFETFLDINTFNKIKNHIEILGYTTKKDYWRIKWLWKYGIHIRIYKPFSKRKCVRLMFVN